MRTSRRGLRYKCTDVSEETFVSFVMVNEYVFMLLFYILVGAANFFEQSVLI